MPFVAHDRDFGRRAVLHDVQQGNDGRRGEIDVAQLGPGFIENVTEGHRYQFQVGCEPLVVAPRQGVEQMVLVRSVPRGRSGGRPVLQRREGCIRDAAAGRVSSHQDSLCR